MSNKCRCTLRCYLAFANLFYFFEVLSSSVVFCCWSFLTDKLINEKHFDCFVGWISRPLSGTVTGWWRGARCSTEPSLSSSLFLSHLTFVSSHALRATWRNVSDGLRFQKCLLLGRLRLVLLLLLIFRLSSSLREPLPEAKAALLFP